MHERGRGLVINGDTEGEAINEENGNANSGAREMGAKDS